MLHLQTTALELGAQVSVIMSYYCIFLSSTRFLGKQSSNYFLICGCFKLPFNSFSLSLWENKADFPWKHSWCDLLSRDKFCVRARSWHGMIHESNDIRFVVGYGEINPLNMNLYVAFSCSYAHTRRVVSLLGSSQETTCSTLLLVNVPFFSLIMWFVWKQA